MSRLTKSPANHTDPQMTVSAAWRSGDRTAAWDALWRRILREVLSGDESGQLSPTTTDGVDPGRCE